MPPAAGVHCPPTQAYERTGVGAGGTGPDGNSAWLNSHGVLPSITSQSTGDTPLFKPW